MESSPRCPQASLLINVTHIGFLPVLSPHVSFYCYRSPNIFSRVGCLEQTRTKLISLVIKKKKESIIIIPQKRLIIKKMTSRFMFLKQKKNDFSMENNQKKISCKLL